MEGRRKGGGGTKVDVTHLTPLSSSISLNCLCRSSSDFPALSCTAFFSASATSVNWECTSTMGAPLTLSCKSDDSSMDLISPSPSPSESESLLGLLLQVPLSFPHFALHKVKSSDRSLSAVRHSLANFQNFSSSPFFSFPYMYIPLPLSPTSLSFLPPTIPRLPYIPHSFSSPSLSLPPSSSCPPY